MTGKLLCCVEVYCSLQLSVNILPEVGMLLQQFRFGNTNSVGTSFYILREDCTFHHTLCTCFCSRMVIPTPITIHIHVYTLHPLILSLYGVYYQPTLSTLVVVAIL